MILTDILLFFILVGTLANCFVIQAYFRRKKPGPRPGKKKTSVAINTRPPGSKNDITARKRSTINNTPPRKRFRAQDYPEIPMK